MHGANHLVNDQQRFLVGKGDDAVAAAVQQVGCQVEVHRFRAFEDLGNGIERCLFLLLFHQIAQFGLREEAGFEDAFALLGTGALRARD